MSYIIGNIKTGITILIGLFTILPEEQWCAVIHVHTLRKCRTSRPPIYQVETIRFRSEYDYFDVHWRIQTTRGLGITCYVWGRTRGSWIWAVVGLLHIIWCKHSNLTLPGELLSVGSGTFLGPRIIICWPTLQELLILNIGLPNDVSGSLKWHIWQ